MFLLKVRTRLKNVRDKYRQCFFWKLVIGFNPLTSLSRHFLQKPSLMGFLCHKKQSLHVHIKGGANAFRGKYFLFSPGTWNYFHSHQITHPNKNNKEKQKTSNFRINYECFRILTVKTKQCTYTWSFAHTLDLRKKKTKLLYREEVPPQLINTQQDTCSPSLLLHSTCLFQGRRQENACPSLKKATQNTRSSPPAALCKLMREMPVSRGAHNS